MEELCALCRKRARMLCESDQAKLCWDCDRKVHGANFLVAKHLRVLLCSLCQCPTPWKASGPSLTPTSSLCHRCVPTTTQSPNNHHVHDDDDGGDEGYHSSDDEEEESDGDDVPEEDEEEEEEGEGENQVVPWSSASASGVVGVAGSASLDNDGDMSSNTASGACSLPLSLKRSPHNIYHSEDEDETGCCSSEGLANFESSSVSMFRPLKQPRISQREAAQWHNQRWGRTRIEDKAMFGSLINDERSVS